MKPSNFKLNTDYLTLANVENLTFKVSIPSVQIPNSGLYTAEYTKNCKNLPIAITRACMHHSTWSNPSLYGVGRYGTIVFENSNQDVFNERVHLSTPNGSTLKLTIELQGTVGTTAPAHTVTVKVFRFRVPNVF